MALKDLLKRMKINATGIAGQIKANAPIFGSNKKLDYAARPNKTGYFFTEEYLGPPGSKHNGMTYDQRVQKQEIKDGKKRAEAIEKISRDRTNRVNKMNSF
jgi:hypothetical protein